MREKILVIKLSALGDFLLAMGAMEAIRKHHPDAHITLLTTRLFLDMAQRSKYFDAIEIDAKPKFYDISGWLHLARFLNGGRFTRIYDLQMSDRTASYLRLLLRRPKDKGLARGDSPLFATAGFDGLHVKDRFKALFAERGIAAGLPDLSWMHVDVSYFSFKKPYVLLIPGSAPSRPEKRWPALKYGALALRLSREGFDVGVIGTAAEQDVIAKILAACPEAKDLSGRTSFYDIASLAAGAAAAVGNDTGPTHLVSLAGCPAVALFSSASDPLRSAPVGDSVTVIQSDDLSQVSVADVMKNLKFRSAE